MEGSDYRQDNVSLQSSVLESCLIIKGHCAASRKVAVSIRDDVVGFFY